MLTHRPSASPQERPCESAYGSPAAYAAGDVTSLTEETLMSVKARPVVPWMGGKRRLAAAIIEAFPEHQCYVEVFAGGAAVLFEKEPSKVEVLNDINGELINLYRVIQHHLDEFMRQFRWALTSRQMYEWEKMKPPYTLTDIQRAARFFYLTKLGFGARLTSPSFGTATTSKPRLNLLRLEEDLSAAHLRLHGVTVEHLTWQEVVSRYDRPHTLFFMDPPYWETAGYGREFGWEQYEALAALKGKIQGKAIITLNDHPDIARAFQDWNRRELNIRYTVGGGKGVEARELLLTSFYPQGGDHGHKG